MSGKRRTARGETEDQSSLTARRSPLAFFVQTAMEAVLLLLVCLSPWAYGSIHPGFEFLLDVGIAVLLALWAVRILVQGQVSWKKSGVALCLAGLFLLGVWQRTPLPQSVLSWLSPGAERCYNQLLPKQPEVLPASSGEPPAPSPYPSVNRRPGSTLSLYPDATRRETLRMLAVFLVFSVVYNNLASSRALLRLGVVAVINGVLLSLFALVQFFSAPRNTVYWIYPTVGKIFGPFINRNHFPDYVNLCIGLGIGLLVRQNLRSRSSALSEEEGSLMQTLHDPRALWICAALVLMVSAAAFSLSRGGMLALVAATVLCGGLGWLHLGRSLRIGSLLLIAGAVLALSAWFGIDLLKERLATLGGNEAFEEGRVPLWLRSLPIVGEFPIWGTGYGTYGYIEPKYRKDAPSRETPGWYTHAHNDYLEILVEGGIVGLALLTAALVIIFRQGYRALIRNRDRPEAGLALGALLGFTALVFHSFTEFGAHTPAITLFATVLAAHLCALGQSKHRRPAAPARDDLADNDEYRLRLAGFAPALGAIAILGLGLVLCASGWKAHRIDRLQAAPVRTEDANVEQLRNRIDSLSAAASLDPDNAEIHNGLGRTHARLVELLEAGNRAERGEGPTQAILALQEYLHARNCCPLLSEAQLGIALFASQLKQGDGAEDYLGRVKLLIPGQVEMYYQCGFVEYKLNHLEDAWKTWKRCLELSDDYLPQILLRTRNLKADQLVEKVLPDNPDLLIVAPSLLYPDGGTVEKRRPFLDKALRILDSKPEGMVRRDLNVGERTLKARCDFARYLYEQGKLEAARRELRLVLAQRSAYGPARELLNQITRQRR